MKILKAITAALLAASVTIGASAQAMTVTYSLMDVPEGSYFKSCEPYTAIARNSAQGQFISRWGWLDENGFMRCGGEHDLGIEDDYYLVAMGTYYAKAVGEKFRVTLDSGKVIYVAIGDFKANCDTNSTNQWGVNDYDILEFICDWSNMNRDIRQAGSCNVFMPLNGKIIQIEKIKFEED